MVPFVGRRRLSLAIPPTVSYKDSYILSSSILLTSCAWTELVAIGLLNMRIVKVLTLLEYAPCGYYLTGSTSKSPVMAMPVIF